MRQVVIMPSASLLVAIAGGEGGGGSVFTVCIMPSPPNTEMESNRVKTTDTKSCRSVFMVFPARVKVQLQAERIVGEDIVPA